MKLWKLLRKRRMLIGALALTMTVGATVVQAADADKITLPVPAKFPIFSGGKQVNTGKDPVVIDGSTYIPLRALGEALGKQIDWNDWERTITLKNAPKIKSAATWKNPGSLGKGISEGGFSGLTRIPGDPANVFYTLADRGPNGQVGKEKLRTFPIDDFNPRIYKIKAEGDSLEVLETIKLQLPDGKTDAVTKSKYITGLSNTEGADEIPYDELGQKKLSYDPDGLDLEGIAYNPNDDTFWLSDEYRPSLVQVKRDGTVLNRFVPFGAKALLKDAQMNVVELFPAFYNQRVSNRGFEGVTITPDGKYLYVSIQSPLALPDQKTSDNSRNLRILKMDLAKKELVGEYVYYAENAASYEGIKQKDQVISDLYALSANVLLVDERDKMAGKEAQVKRIYKSDFSKATNLLGTDYSANLEAMPQDMLRQAGIVPVTKELIVDFVKLGYPYEKIEGITAIDKRTIAIVNDNDFAVSYDEQGKLSLTGTPTQLHVVELQEDLY
ncbi:esterase-like activity of phytase family protein [Paenibacillus sp. MBLB4367]|uniref:esterase-like activity of phytase family protein n=1 Tax=Paenibacillus sp. MBLB4367 TaxID=3384767 RepID=UPI0039081B99